MNQIVQEMLDRGSTWTEKGRSAPFWFKAPAPGRAAVDDLSALMLRTALNGVWVVAVWGYEDSRCGHRTRVTYWEEAPSDPTELL